MNRSIRCLVLAALAWPSLARAESPPPSLPLAEVVARARVVADKRPSRRTCKVHVEVSMADGDGKPQHGETRDGTATQRGDGMELQTDRLVRDGKLLSPAELAEERANQKKPRKRGEQEAEYDLAPLARKNADGEEFELLRRDTLWGRPVYVLRVQATGSGDSLASGTLWIDGERFVELKGELTPAKLPAHADWVRVQEQFTLDAAEVPQLTLLRIDGAGHFLFIRRQFHSTMRWSDCH